MVRPPEPERDAAPGRCPPPRVKLPGRGTFLGVAWSAAQGAGAQIVAARIACEPDRARLVSLSRPFQDTPTRRGVVERTPGWLAEETRQAGGSIVVGLDFPFSLAE